MGGDKGGKRRKGFQENERDTCTKLKGVRSRVASGGGWGGGKWCGENGDDCTLTIKHLKIII